MRKTKIICTMGPATDSDEVLEKLMQGGMNVARFNFSHGSHEEQKERMDRLKAMREKCGKPVAMLLDTKGPEIRTGIFEEGKVTKKTKTGGYYLYEKEKVGTGCHDSCNSFSDAWNKSRSDG